MISFQELKCRLGFHGIMDVTEQSGHSVRFSHKERKFIEKDKKKIPVDEVVITAQKINHHLMIKTCKHCGQVYKRWIEFPVREFSIIVDRGTWDRRPFPELYFYPTHDNPFALSQLGQKKRKYKEVA